MITVSLISSAVINLIMPYIPDINLMKYLWALNGVAQSILWSSIIKILGEYLPAEYMNKLSITVPIGTALAYSISAIASILGVWKIVFYAASILLALTAMIWWLCLGNICKTISPIDSINDTNKLPTEQVNLADKRRNLGYIISVIVVACIGGVFNNFTKDGIVTWVPSFLKDNYNMPGYFSILLTLLLPLVSVGGALVSQRLYKLIRDYFSVGIISFAISAVSLALLLFL